jgi:hydroxymethylbilane synthase
MSKIIRIGTHDNELALHEAKIVQHQLEHLDHKTELVPIQSKEVFLLHNNSIDIAVHSLNTLPTVLQKGIIQAAVLKCGNKNDTLVYKTTEEFLSQKEALIASNSLLRRAQWLNMHPTHTFINFDGNVTSRLQELEDNENWNAAFFAASEIGRMGLRPETAINLNWMIPAPAQGVIIITAREEDEETQTICAEINHEETQICSTIEREFQKLLEDQTSLPIGALAYIKNEEVNFKGIILSPDGSKKIEVERIEKLGEHNTIAQYCYDYIMERSGNRLIDIAAFSGRQAKVYSTKSFTKDQNELINDAIKIKRSDFVKVSLNRIPKYHLKSEIKNVIITDRNAVEALTTNYSAIELQFKNIYCVGRRTKQLIENKIGSVTHFENNIKKLANYLVDYIEGIEATYFCGDSELDILPTILEKSNINVTTIEAFQTKYDAKKINENIEGIMFYNPLTIESYLLENESHSIAFCINEATANKAKEHFKDVRIAKMSTIESLIKLVNENYA